MGRIEVGEYKMKMNMRLGAKALIAIMLIGAIMFAAPSVGRFIPTHKIVQPVYCGSCHPEQVQELSATTHLGKFTEEVVSFTEMYSGNSSQGATKAVKPDAYSNARAISGGCVMCHNYWENFKWYGVVNFDMGVYDNGDLIQPPPTDIYGNPVSPYGLGSTKQYYMKVSELKGTAPGASGLSTEPWKAGLDVYQYVDINGSRHSRLDYVWSRLSAVSPGPVTWGRVNTTTGAASGCGGGTVEHGMCHMAASSVALAYVDQKYEVSDYPNLITGSGGNITTPLNATQTTNLGKAMGRSGKGIFFTHEMAFTTAQYAAKPVKICGACHVMKLPPMQWGGEPWSISDMKVATAAGGSSDNMKAAIAGNDDPFGFRPDYNGLTAFAGENMNVEALTRETGGNAPNTADFPVAFRTADWAHANVPCVRCHVHAGINGETVSNTNE